MGIDDESFDPKSWGRPATTPPSPGASIPPAPPPTESAPAAAEPAAPALADGDDLWAGIGRRAAKAEAPPPPPGAPPKRVSAPGLPPLAAYGLAAVLLLGGATGAWLTRAPAQVLITDEPVAATSEAPPPPSAEERALNLGSAAEIVAALTAAGVSPAEAQAVAQAAAAALTKPGEIRAAMVLVPNPDGKGYAIQRFQASYPDGSGTVVARGADGQFTGSAVAAELTKEIKVLRGELDSESFYSSAVAAGLVDSLIPEFINAFGYDFNLAAEVKPGDTFEVGYEQEVNASGEPVGQPRLLFGSLTTAQKSLALYRFQPQGGEAGWYDGNGGSTKRGLMRTPVDGARITSNFGMRFHPVLHYNRLHAGVDFGVPIGTPVYAAADGVVIGSVPTGCGGNMAVIQHDNGWVTRYFHLSKFADGLHNGQRVTQGFTVGLSGTTGTCTTGPHLHYELRIDGQPVDPMSIPTGDSEKKKLEGPLMAAFLAQRNRVDVARAKNGI